MSYPTIIKALCIAGSDIAIFAGQIYADNKSAVDFGNSASVDCVGSSRYNLFIAAYKMFLSAPDERFSTSANSLSIAAPATSRSATANDSRVRVRAVPNLHVSAPGYLDKGDILVVLEKSAERMKIDTANDY